MYPADAQAFGLSSSRWADMQGLRKQTKSFDDLPAEIRNSIYRYSFVDCGHDVVNGVNTKFPGIGLLRLNKQTHLESSGILYGNNAFTFGLDIDWRNNPEVILYGFPKTLPIWPAPRYHSLLRRLEVQVRFTAGRPHDLEAPEIMQNQIQAMRDAYDGVWDGLDIHFKFMGGNLTELTFTMAWIKFRMLEPISHPNCFVETETKVPAPVRWALEAALQQKDLKAALSEEQLQVLSDVEDIVDDTTESSIIELADRLAYGTIRVLPPPPAPTPLSAQGGLAQSLFGLAPATTQAQQAQNPIQQSFTNQLLASFSRLPPFGASTSGAPLMPNSTHTAPNPFGPPYAASLPHSSGNGFVPASSIHGPAPSSLFGNGSAQSTMSPSGNALSSSLFGYGSGHTGPHPSNNFVTQFPQPHQLPSLNGSLMPHTQSALNNPGPAPAPSTYPFGPGPLPFPSSQPFSQPPLHPLPPLLLPFNNIPPPSAQNAPNIPAPLPPPLRLRLYRAREIREQLRGSGMTDREAVALLIHDNEMRVLAALDLPGDVRELSIRGCGSLRFIFELMQRAGEITALKRCLEEEAT
ncbi:hypothetical protein FKW77_002202 [Venturia effusa]|uniref:Uncharacterized protein n=1 Tax=Venturia effusa TaxID=50376 RepID=A0A517LAH3_9PEZI|nr:hypothetical protein FKW77_002202 [Venturia effusa]